MSLLRRAVVSSHLSILAIDTNVRSIRFWRYIAAIPDQRERQTMRTTRDRLRHAIGLN